MQITLLYCFYSILISSPYGPDSAFPLLSKNQFHKFFVSFTMYISQHTTVTDLTSLQPFSEKDLSFSVRYNHFFITFPEGKIKKTQLVCHLLSEIDISPAPKLKTMTHPEGSRRTSDAVVVYQRANGVRSQCEL